MALASCQGFSLSISCQKMTLLYSLSVNFAHVKACKEKQSALNLQYTFHFYQYLPAKIFCVFQYLQKDPLPCLPYCLHPPRGDITISFLLCDLTCILQKCIVQNNVVLQFIELHRILLQFIKMHIIALQCIVEPSISQEVE